jgi:Flp pilus assembly protein CpaB
LIQPRAHVDVLFTRTGSMAEAITSTILEDVVVLAMGRVTEVTPAPAAPTTTTTTVQTNVNRSATLLVTPEQARVLELAKNQGRISLALRNPLDRSASATRAATTAEALYSNLPPARRPGGPAKAPPKQEAKAEPPPPPPPPAPPPEPPKPRTVDVYRGDKHVQERF